MTKQNLKNLFIFQTGHAKGLAKAEILSLLPDSIVDEVFDGFVVNTEIPNPTALLNRMGGIVRITEVIQSGPANMPLNFEEWVVSAISDIASKGKKIRYGLSMHPKSEKILKKTLIGSKKNLKLVENVGNVRFVNKDFKNLSSVQAWHEKLLKENGLELHLFQSSENSENPKWYLSKTLAIQNFEAYSHRDYDRPARSAANGMFPPKLAQILINLAIANQNQAPSELTIYDPFCGSGTVMQEAWLMNYPAQGSDISEQMVKDSKENLTWLKKDDQFTAGRNSEPENLTKVFHADATHLTSSELPTPPFAIVTETWLGPVLTKPLTDLERPKVQREVEALYEAFFSNLKNLCAGTDSHPITVVFTAPYHREGNQRHFLPNLPAILAEHTEIVPLSDHERPSLFFERKNQLVSREIWKVRLTP